MKLESDHIHQVTKMELDGIEATLGVSLPVRYREFLLRENGGQIAGWRDCVFFGNGQDDYLQFSYFYYAVHPNRVLTIVHHAQHNTEFLKLGWLPIAGETGGGLVLTNIRDTGCPFGSLGYISADELESEGDAAKIVLFAKSIEDIASLLVESPI